MSTVQANTATTPAAESAAANQIAPAAAPSRRQAPVTKAAASPSKALKPARKPSAVGTGKAASVASASEPVKDKKAKLVRDGFTIPKAEYQVLAELKLRAAGLQFPAKKSEIVRAGIKALAAMPGAAFLAALQAVPPIKTGRPGKG